jgi:hypothetical protein
MPWVKRPTNRSNVLKHGRISTDDDEGSSRSSTTRCRPLIAGVETVVDCQESCRGSWNLNWFMIRMHLTLSNVDPSLLTTIRNSNDIPSVKISSKGEITMGSFEKCHYRWWGVGYVREVETNNLHTGRVLFRLPSRNITGAFASKSHAACFSIIEALCITNSLLKVRQLSFLSDGSETCVGCGKKQATWNVDCGMQAPSAQ